jgi:SAM-dependent methyltransferase
MSASSYDPRLYELFFADRTADVAWYLAQARAIGGPILELGAGTGRTLLPIAAAGIDITGLEPAVEMRAFLQQQLDRAPAHVQEHAQIVAGDMTTFSNPGSYRVIQIPFRTFLHNTDRASQLACLQRCFENLQPGGTLALDVFNPSVDYIATWLGPGAGVWRLTDERRRPDGSLVLLSESTAFDLSAQTLRSRHRYDVYGPAGQQEGAYLQELELAYLFAGDLRALLMEAGFTAIEMTGDFSPTPSGEDDEIVVTARRGD